MKLFSRLFGKSKTPSRAENFPAAPLPPPPSPPPPAPPVEHRAFTHEEFVQVKSKFSGWSFGDAIETCDCPGCGEPLRLSNDTLIPALVGEATTKILGQTVAGIIIFCRRCNKYWQAHPKERVPRQYTAYSPVSGMWLTPCSIEVRLINEEFPFGCPNCAKQSRTQLSPVHLIVPEHFYFEGNTAGKTEVSHWCERCKIHWSIRFEKGSAPSWGRRYSDGSSMRVKIFDCRKCGTPRSVHASQYHGSTVEASECLRCGDSYRDGFE